MVELDHLKKLASHLEGMDSESGDAKAIRWAIAEIESLYGTLTGHKAPPLGKDRNSIIDECAERAAWVLGPTTEYGKTIAARIRDLKASAAAQTNHNG